MRKWWKQFTCLHRWCKGYAIQAEMYRGYLYRYHCHVCDKNILRWSIYGEPISGLPPKDLWAEYKKDPQMNVSPPIIKIDD